MSGMPSKGNWNLAPRLEDAKTSFLKGLRYASSTSAGDRERINRILAEREMEAQEPSKLELCIDCGKPVLKPSPLLHRMCQCRDAESE